MALETGVTYIEDLVTTNPVGATDNVDEGDDHIRNIKTAVKGSFPNLGAVAVTKTAADINNNVFNGTVSGTAIDATYMSLTPGILPTSFAVSEYLEDRVRSARINSNGTVHSQVGSITSVKNSTGNYTLTHDIGDLLYVAVVSLFGAVAGVAHVLSYNTTTITITVDDLAGSPVDSAFTVIISAW